MTNTIKTLILSTGYVESQSLSVLIVRHDTGFNTPEEAIVHFSEVLKTYTEKERKYALDYKRTAKDCCKKTLEKLACSAFCAKCGTRLAEEPLEYQDILETYERMENGTLDSFGDGWEYFQNHGWEVPCMTFDSSEMTLVSDFRPVISGLYDEDARCSNNEIGSTATRHELRKFDRKAVPAGFVFANEDEDEEWGDENDEDEDEGDSEQYTPINELIFCLVKSFDIPTWTASISPKNYFVQNGCCYDQHLLVDIPGWGDIQEGVYEPDNKNKTPDQLHAHLESLGLKFDMSLALFLKGLGNTVHIPTPSAVPAVTHTQHFQIGTTSVTAPVIPAGKIETDLCRQVIADMVKQNPGLVATQFSDPSGNPVSAAESAQLDTDASNPKNWKRSSKEKDGNLNLRLFGCKPMDDQLRAYVRDDGKTIVSILIIGE